MALYDKPYQHEFDVSSDVSLEELKKEITPHCKSDSTKVVFDLWGPGGGNTRVLVYTDDKEDYERIKSWSDSWLNTDSPLSTYEIVED